MENRYAQLIWTAKTGRGMRGTKHRVEARREARNTPSSGRWMRNFERTEIVGGL
jgi:hypothetical protein